VLGAIIGSFLNVVALRWNTGKSLGGRSSCAVCQKTLEWRELIPVISFFLIRGRCSECKTRVSWQYPLVEALTGLVFATLYSVLSFSLLAYISAVIIFCVYIVILVYDLRHMIIPDALVYLSIGLALLFHLRFYSFNLWDWLVGPIIFALFGLIWLLSRGRAMGFGDAKLGLSIGLFLGLTEGLSAMVLAFWIGTVVALFLLGLSRTKSSLFGKGKGLTMKSEVPFAPFMILGAWLAIIFHFDLLHVLSFR
jgi:prepilin signal peptidase PulO-like enzyme (type II secretory pathway)